MTEHKNLHEHAKSIEQKSDTQNSYPKGYCPNCWGREEYGGNFYEEVAKRNMNALDDKYDSGWVDNYAVTHLKGAQLEDKGNAFACPTCAARFVKVEDQSN